ncbi:putative ribonuclease H-like domain-containing protein, partial [Tanacetum coccineum]
MLADSLLPITLWAEAVNTSCYVQNRVLVTKPHNKTPYELLIGRTPIIRFMRPFGCPVTILNTLDHLGKFDGKADKGFLVGYSINSKDFRVFNRSGPEWLFDIDSLTNSMNYQPVSAGNRTNGNVGLETNSDAGQAGKENVPDQEYILLPLIHTSGNVLSHSEDIESSPKDDAVKKNEVKDPTKEGDMNGQGEATHTNSTNRLNNVSSLVDTVSSSFATENPGQASSQRNEFESLFGQDKLITMPSGSSLLLMLLLLPILIILLLGRSYTGRASPVQTTECLDTGGFTSWIEAIRLFLAYASYMDFTVYQMDVKSAFLYGTIEEEVYVCQPPGFVDLEFPNRVYKVEKALYGLHQAPRAWYETLSTYLLENGFRRWIIDKTLFIKKITNDILLIQVYVDDIIFGSTQKSLSTELEQLMHKRFQMSSIGELTFFLGLQVEQRKDGIFL